MQRTRIRLETRSDIRNFVNEVSTVTGNVYLTDGQNFRVSAKSLLGAICTIEWDKLYVEHENDTGAMEHILNKYRVLDD